MTIARIGPNWDLLNNSKPGPEGDLKQQVAPAARQRLVHEAAVEDDRQGVCQMPGDVVGQVIVEEGSGAGGIRQERPEQRVMRKAVCRRVAPGGGLPGRGGGRPRSAVTRS